MKLNDSERGSGPTEEAPLKHTLRALAVLIFLAAVAPPSLEAQVPRGSVSGKIVGVDGKPLAGVMVTLSRPQTADLKVKTGPTGIYRFASVRPAADYTVKAEHPEHRTAVRANVAVGTDGRATVDLVMEVGKPEEQAAATGAVPMIDRTRTRQGLELSRLELQTLPAAPDPWIGLQLVPAVMADRENVGGTETTGPAVFTAKGDASNGAGNIWRVDGIDVTDPVDLGRPAVSFDLGDVDTVSVTTGGATDLTAPTGGIVVNVLTRRGDNRLGGSARFDLTDDAFQSNNLTSTTKNLGVAGINRIEQIKGYGANLGGPIVKNRIWLWGSYGVSDIHTYTIYDQPDQALLGNVSFKLDIRPFAGNRFETQFMASSKMRYGFNGSTAAPEGYDLRSVARLGDPVFKLQDEQTIGGNFAFLLKATIRRTGSIIRPAVDEDLSNPIVFDVARAVFVPFSNAHSRSWDSGTFIRKSKDIEAAAKLFRDGFLGASHEFRATAGIADKAGSGESGYAQNFLVYRDFVDPLIDLGEGLVVPPSDWQKISVRRDSREKGRVNHAFFSLQDTMTRGRFALALGLRYDRQAPSTDAYPITAVLAYGEPWKAVFSSQAMGAIDSYLPALNIRAIRSKYRWSTWAPRIGLSWDVRGDGRTVAKLSLARYGDLMTPGAFTTKPLGLTGGMDFWWRDADGNGLVGPDEMHWQYSSVHPEKPFQLYPLFTEGAELTTDAYAALQGGFESDAYLAGNYRDYDWWDSEAVSYDAITTFYRSDIDPEAKNVKTSPRTREVVLSLEKELRPDLAASIAATYRRFDNFDWAKAFYPANIYPSTPDLVVDNSQPWYAAAGTVPAKITVTDDQGNVEKEYDLLEAGGKTWYLPIASFPGETPFRLVDKSRAFRTYYGLDLGLTKRLSHRWMASASVTLQDQRVHWNGSFIDPTNQWALDGKPYGNWAEGVGGKAPAQMFARWMAKVSALYQMPLGITAALTVQAREGWRIPHYITLAFADEESWEGLYRSNVVYLQAATKDRLSAYRNVSFRLEKSLGLGSGRVTFMADVFNIFNWATVNRAYDAYLGTYYVDTDVFVANPNSRRYSEILNPRVLRLGVRFDF